MKPTRSSHTAANIWAVGTRALSAAGITAIWDKNISAYSGAGYAGTYVKMLRDDWLNGGRLDLILDAINTETGTHPTLAEMEASTVLALKSQLITQGTNDFNATAKAAIEAECGDALTTYDPPTRTEATTDKGAIITEVNANETKIDIIDTNVDSVLADTGTDGVVVATASKTGYALSGVGIDSIFDEVVEGTATFRQMLRIKHAALAGKSTGGGTTTLTFRDIADSKPRITATVDASGNRTAMTVDGA